MYCISTDKMPHPPSTVTPQYNYPTTRAGVNSIWISVNSESTLTFQFRQFGFDWNLNGIDSKPAMMPITIWAKDIILISDCMNNSAPSFLFKRTRSPCMQTESTLGLTSFWSMAGFRTFPFQSTQKVNGIPIPHFPNWKELEFQMFWVEMELTPTLEHGFSMDTITTRYNSKTLEPIIQTQTIYRFSSIKAEHS